MSAMKYMAVNKMHTHLYAGRYGLNRHSGNNTESGNPVPVTKCDTKGDQQGSLSRILIRIPMNPHSNEMATDGQMKRCRKNIHSVLC